MPLNESMTYEEVINEFPEIRAEILWIKKRNEKWDILRDYIQVLHQFFLDIETHKINEKRSSL